MRSLKGIFELLCPPGSQRTYAKLYSSRGTKTSTRTSANSYDLLNSIMAETEPDTIGGNTMASSEYPATKKREDTVCAIEDVPGDDFSIKDDHLSTVLSMYNILVISLRYEYIPSHL